MSYKFIPLITLIKKCNLYCHINSEHESLLKLIGVNMQCTHNVHNLNPNDHENSKMEVCDS
jgi:hypothetical protein